MIKVCYEKNYLLYGFAVPPEETLIILYEQFLLYFTTPLDVEIIYKESPLAVILAAEEERILLLIHYIFFVFISAADDEFKYEHFALPDKLISAEDDAST